MNRLLLSFALVSLLAGCAEDTACRSLFVGQSTAGLKMTRLTDPRPFGLSLLSRASPQRPDFDTGPVEANVCCVSKRMGEPLSWCDAAQLECTDPALDGVELYSLGEPYTVTHSPEYGYFCLAAVKEGRIVAVLMRYWS